MPATAADTPTIPVTFRASESQVAKLQTSVIAQRKATGEAVTMSGLVRSCVERHLDQMSGAAGSKRNAR